MIRSIRVVCHADVEDSRAVAVAVIVISTPGCDIRVRPVLPALLVSFNTLAGELEAASLRLPHAMAAVPFDIAHAQAILAFVTAMQQQVQELDLQVYESGGYSRSVTVARWLARRFGYPLHEPATAAAAASCTLMEAVLHDLPRTMQPVAHPALVALEPELQA